MKGLRVALLLAAVAAMLLHLWQFRDFTVDDAAISYAYARNLAHGHGLVNIPGSERVEGYTNFLWVATVALGVLFRDDVFLVAKILAALLSVALVIGSAELAAALRGRRSPIDAAPALLVATVLPISYWAMSGLEAPLYMTLVVWCAARLIVENDRPRARPWSALLAAGVALTRPDGLLVLAAALLMRLDRDRRWRRFGTSWYALALAPVAAHFLFRYCYYAYPWPNTFYAKVHGTPFDRHELTDLNAPGWSYIIALFDGHHLSPLRWVAALTVLGFRRWYGRAVVLVMFGALLAFPIYARHDWMSEGRFVTPSLPLFITLFSDGAEQAAATLVALLVRIWPLSRAWRATVVAGGALAVQVYYGKYDLVPHEIASTLWRRGFYPVRAEIVLQRALNYQALGKRLEIKEPSAAEGDLGGTSVAGGMRIVDLGALCDVTLAHQVENPTAVREYVLDEQRPVFFRLDGHWADYGFAQRPEFQDGWTPMNAPNFGGGHWIARSVFAARGVDPRAPLHSFTEDGVDLLGAEVTASEAQLWLLVRKLPAFKLWLESAAGRVEVAVGGDIYPTTAWREGEVLHTRVRRPAGALRICGRAGCVPLAEGASGARPIELPAPACARLLERGELIAAAAACRDSWTAETVAARLHQRGSAAEAAGDLDRAYRDFRLALALDPTRAFARKHLEALRTKRRGAYHPRWRLRASAAERAFHRSPDETHLSWLAAAALAVGDPEAAVRAQVATSLVPREAAARLDLAECDFLSGRPQLAVSLLPPAESDEGAARIMRIAYAAGAPEAARAAIARLSRTSLPVAPGLVLAAAWARPLRAGDIELSLALRKTGEAAPDRLTVGDQTIPFDRPPRTWDADELFVHTVRLDLAPGKSRVVVGSTSLQLDAHPFSGDFERGRLDGWEASGEAFRDQPRQLVRMFGVEGARTIDTRSFKDAATGQLRSPPLAAGLDDVCFMLAGGQDPAHEGVALEVDGRRMSVETGLNSDNFAERCFELESLDRHAVRLVVFDDRGGTWGHVVFDDLECSSQGRPAACFGHVDVLP